MKKILVLLLLAAGRLAAADFGQVATSGAQLLKINFDPRASALGYAAASVVNNASAVYTNIAGTAFVQNADVAFTYCPWFADIKMMSAAAAYRAEGIGVFSLQFAGFNSKEEITTIDQPNGTGEQYSISNLVVGVGLSRSVMENLVVGIQAKYYSESYYGHSASAIAFDLGTNYSLGFAGSRLALTLQNFGPNVRPLSGSYLDYADNNVEKNFTDSPLPVTFRASFTSEPITGDGYRIRFSADLVHPNDNTEHYNLGTEIVLMDAIALRGGLKMNYDDESFAAGVGIDGSKLIGSGLRLDYSYEYFKILPSIQKISIGYTL
jgi:hypothetical protein